jgi:UDP-2-acetamido-2,6-beta-L-arabino-hexul-4-ose reductase
MIKIGITGQSGFVGTHLYNYFGIKENIKRIPFNDEFFDSKMHLENFVSQCDVIVHLAAMNRHSNPQVIYDTNIQLVKQLIEACELTKSTPHVLFSSSTQEERDNLYGKSKLDGRKLLKTWAKRNNAVLTGLLIPNVFGPFGTPYYNSFIATFSHQLTHDEQPEIQTDGDVKLIYVGELVEEIYKRVITNASITDHQSPITKYHVQFTVEVKVSKVFNLLTSYKENYLKKGITPDLNNSFERNLFNTFLCYINHKEFFPFDLTKHTDKRGGFVEIHKLNSGGQVSFSTTVAGVTRGNHFHTRKAERFTVIKGKARIELRKIGTKEVLSFELDGEKPSFVDMPIWYTHNITNIGDKVLYTIFWINEHYNPEDGDTYFEKV